MLQAPQDGFIVCCSCECEAVKDSQNNIRAQLAGALTVVRDGVDWRAERSKEGGGLADICRKPSIDSDAEALIRLRSPMLGGTRFLISSFRKDGEPEKPTGQKERKYSKEGIRVLDPGFHLSRQLLAAGRDDLRLSAA